MKKAIIILLVIVAACFLCANLNYIMSIIDAMQGGALIPLVIACIIMVARHVVQAMSYNEAFGAVGQKTGLWHNIVLIFSRIHQYLLLVLGCNRCCIHHRRCPPQRP